MAESDVVIRIRLEMEKTKMALKTFRGEFNKTGKFLDETAMLQGKLEKQTDRLNKSLGKSPFAGYAMSIMFAGMALQRYSMQLYKFGTKAFQEISHSIAGTVTNTDILEGSMKFLGFTIGEALEPTLAYLIPIVDKISEWTNKNPELVATLTTLGIILGTVAMFFGMGKLAAVGLLDGFTKLKIAVVAGKGALTAFAGVLGTTVLVAIGIIIAIIAVLYAMWKTNFGGMRDFFVNTFGILWQTVKSVFGHIWKIVKIVLGIIVAIFEGDFDKVGELLVDLLKNLAALFLKGLTGIGAIIINVLAFAWNLAVDVVFKIVAGLMSGIARLIITSWQDILGFLASIAGDKVSEALGLNNAIAGLENFKNKIVDVEQTVKDFGQGIKAGYLSGDDIKTAFAGVDNLLKLDIEKPSKNQSSVPNVTNNWVNPIFQVESKGIFDDIMNGVNQ